MNPGLSILLCDVGIVPGHFGASNLMVSQVPYSSEILGFCGSLVGRERLIIVWSGHRGVGLTSRVSKLTELRKCLSVIHIWSRDRWWSLEEGKFAHSPRAGGREANSAALVSDGMKVFRPEYSLHLDLSREAAPCELTLPSQVLDH